MNARSRRRSAAVMLVAVTLGAVLTGCKGDEARSVPGPSSTSSSGAGKGTGGGGAATPAGEAGATPAGTATATPAGEATATPAGEATATPADCVNKAPYPEDYDPDEFALYGYEELEGVTDKVNLIIQHGAWGCPEPDTDGAPFVVSGEESRWALDQGAYVTATNPIVESTENQRIGVQELLDWLDANPDSGLVFKYELGDDGAIHRLDEVFTP
ncbi:hypothetical protein [Streptomyces sp. NPDC053367]|uniref:hypothetical protein n=1 Tax=Streptomyces sp. NPDC053367 TaxID=3365700 RepID=UPI0037CCCA25